MTYMFKTYETGAENNLLSGTYTFNSKTGKATGKIKYRIP